MLKDKKEINKNLNRHENIYILLSNLKFIISPYFYPESTNENIYFGRSSDLSGYEAFPFIILNSGMVIHNNKTDFTAAGTVQDSHLIPYSFHIWKPKHKAKI